MSASAARQQRAIGRFVAPDRRTAGRSSARRPRNRAVGSIQLRDEQRIAEPHVPAFGERDRLVELRQRDDAAADQKIAERAIGWRERHGYSPASAGRRRNMRCSTNRKPTVAISHRPATIQERKRSATVSHDTWSG